MPTLHAHSFELYLLARKACKVAVEAGQRPNALTNDALVSVVMAAAAAEAFLNELAYHVEVMLVSTADWAPNAVTPQLSACANAVRALETRRAKTTTKYLEASAQLSGKPFNRGVPPFQGFRDLVALRNEIIHVKPFRIEEPHLGTRIAAALEQRGNAKRLFPGARTSWFHVIESPGVGTWACASALGIIRAVLALCPAPQEPDPDPLAALRQFNRPFLDQV